MAASDYQPQLATLVSDAPDGDEWLHEIKFDGYRIGCRIRGGRVSLISRNGHDWTHAFPEVVEAAAALGADAALIDGEVCVVLPDGRTSFQALQNAFKGEGPRATLVYFVFDLLRLGRERLDRQPLEERKARLRALVGRRARGRIRYVDHVEGHGAAFFSQACRTGLEGIISKRRDRPYTAGRRGDWVKTKCILRQEFVIGGFTEPEGNRAGLGALLIGYYDGDRLVPAGKVGTGFTRKSALDLRARLDALEQPSCPFDPAPPRAIARRARWVRPALVGEVAFTEWTGDGSIRHPSFQGLRPDKRPREVVREAPAAPAPRQQAAAGKRQKGRVEVAGVAISHPDRVIYPEPQVTKADLARYYESIARWVVPHVRGRPLTLVRCPTGVSGDCFYMKHSQVWAPGALRRVRIQEKTKVGEYLIADDLDGIVGLVQMGVLEIHTWNSTYDHLERPSRLILDLDPGDGVPWARVVAAAREVRKTLESLDLQAWVKTTGGRGLHVDVPLRPHADWSDCLAFSRALAERLVRARPDEFIVDFAKSARAGKILIDYLRNNRTNTSIAAYSTRARAGAPVSVPLTWAELRNSLQPGRFTVATVAARLKRLGRDPWDDYWSCRQRLTKQHLRAIG